MTFQKFHVVSRQWHAMSANVHLWKLSSCAILCLVVQYGHAVETLFRILSGSVNGGKTIGTYVWWRLYVGAWPLF